MKKIIKTKKIYIKIIILILFIMALIIFILKQFIGQKAIFNKLISGIYNLNYSYIDENGNKIYICGVFEKIEYSDGKVEYVDYKNKENYLIDEKENLINRTKNNGIDDISYYKNYIKNYFNNNFYNYHYIGYENCNSQECITIEFISKNEYADSRSGEKHQKGGVKFWINNKLNVLEKVEYFYINDNSKRISVFETKFEYYKDNNSVNQIKIPASIKAKF